MTSDELKAIITKITAKRNDRMKAADKIIDHPELFETLLKLVFDTNNKDSIKAAWVFEFVCARNLELLAPHLDYFTSQLKKLQFDSAIRPIAKVCEFMAKAHTKHNTSIIKSVITENHIDLITESAFDWLIGPYRVAVKVYAMSALYLFGKNSDWVHEELKLILLKDMQKENPAFCSRGKKILALINKNN